MPTPTPSTDHYVVIGNPIAHSRSPAIHQHFAALTGQSLHYTTCLAPVDGFAQTLAKLQQEGVKGCNVTVPFKAEAARLAHDRDARVQLAGAANTLVLQPDGHILAYNTDGIGLVRDITVNAAQPLSDRHILLLGAGGAAAGALAALLQEGPASVTVVNRTAIRAEALVASHRDVARAHDVQLGALSLAQLEGASLPRQQILINATASSLQGAALPMQALLHCLAPQAFVYDMMYGQAAQPFLQACASHAPGITVRDGLGMLVEQAAEAFAIWRGVRPPAQAVLQVLRAEIDATTAGA
ncbi:shikimate dehydrogenase [Lampropedia cohaerens]|uniref:Shikimate dehydrogenase (NADP(+)) n=1 Tax=Lampropedia cohaerens TaxID=1610491 RepID=A0A0U1PZE5_9BURK|nr:shikimate dehydrogenase [Lampropedia cohaerens]KKW67725.1 shikimate dehydrogenase [Lampropedia cohaerens]